LKVLRCSACASLCVDLTQNLGNIGEAEDVVAAVCPNELIHLQLFGCCELWCHDVTTVVEGSHSRGLGLNGVGGLLGCGWGLVDGVGGLGTAGTATK
jgi:hypothetical protein